MNSQKVIEWVNSAYFEIVICQNDNEWNLMCSNIERDTVAQRDMKNRKMGRLTLEWKA